MELFDLTFWKIFVAGAELFWFVACLVITIWLATREDGPSLGEAAKIWTLGALCVVPFVAAFLAACIGAFIYY